jgi:hypothetical protein
MILPSVEQKYDVIGFLDNDPLRHSAKRGGGGGNP